MGWGSPGRDKAEVSGYILPIADAKNGISTIREAGKEEVLITRYGKPAVVVGFHDDDDGLDYRLEHDATFLWELPRRAKISDSGSSSHCGPA
ncbi:MAG: hypothetical protein HY318_17745 [Armatimonadetes bacterium]|nr:hypothetical protein [Armatimonadota bacterium]